METLQSTIFIEFDVNTKKITFLRGDGILDYDSNATNIYARVKYKNLNGNTVYLTPSELEDYKFSLYTIKPATNNVNIITGKVTDELKQNVYGGVVKFEIPRVCTNRLGIVKCEIHINQGNKIIASSTFVLDVKQSLVTAFDDELLGDEDFPVLKQLIFEIQKASNINDNKRSKMTTYSSDKVENIKEDLDFKIKEKANKNEIFSMANMGQDVKEAMTGGSVAVVGKNAILTENIVDKQVTPTKTSFITEGKNKYNYKVSTIKKSTTIDDYGAEFDTTGANKQWDLIDEYFSFKDDNYAISLNNSEIQTYVFDKDKKFITSSKKYGFGSLILNKSDYAGAAYFKITITGDYTKLQIEEGAEATSFEPYTITINDLDVTKNDITQIQDMLSAISNKNSLNSQKGLYYETNLNYATTSSATTTSQIANGVEHLAVTENVSVRGTFKYSVPMIVDWMFARCDYSQPYYIDFMADCTELEIVAHSNGSTFGLIVDDTIITDMIAIYSNSETAKSYTKFVFPNKKIRKIRIICSNEFRFNGVVTDARGTVFAAAGKKILCAFDGDSITEGVAQNKHPFLDGYVSVIQKVLDFDVIDIASGGTGFVNPGPSGSNRVKILDRLDKIVSRNPNIFIFCCGLNDCSDTYYNDVEQNINDYFSAVKTQLPNTIVIPISPFNPRDKNYTADWTTNLLQINNCCKIASLNCGFPYIDIINGITYDNLGNIISCDLGGIITGEGNVTDIKTTGNRSIYMSADETHPNGEGQRYLGYRLVEEIYKLLK